MESPTIVLEVPMGSDTTTTSDLPSDVSTPSSLLLEITEPVLRREAIKLTRMMLTRQGAYRPDEEVDMQVPNVGGAQALKSREEIR
jgi:hypothetical protein